MKLFKRIYYPVMAAVVAIMLVLGFVDSHTGNITRKRDKAFLDKVDSHIEVLAASPHNSYNSVAQESVRDYIMGKLKAEGSGIKLDSTTTVDDGKNLASYALKDGKPVATVNVQTAKLSQDTLRQAGDDYKQTAVDKTINNIIVAVPGTDTLSGNNGNAILVTAHYDSQPIGGASDAVAPSAMIENAINAVNLERPYKNDIVFLFTDASLEGGLGSLAFMHQFTGFNNIAARVKLAANFNTHGNSGAVMMYESSDNNLKLMSEYAKINDGSFASSASNMLFSLVNGVTDFNSFGDIAKLNFTNVDGSSQYGTSNDTVKNLSKSFVGEQSDMMYKFYNHFADYDLDSLNSKSDAVFFSYLDIMTVWYPVAVAFALVGVIVGLLIAIILVNRKKKAFSWGKVGSGVIVQLLTLVATALSLFILYFLFTLILSGFGVLTLNSITGVIFSSPALIISAMLLTIALASMFYIILKKTFAAKAPDVVRGNTLVWSLAAIILSFALPSVSYLFTFVSVLSLVTLLLTTIFKNKFKAKFGMDIERLFLNVWVIALSLPLFIPIFSIVGALTPAIVLPVTMALFVGLIGFIAPYFDYLKPTLDKVAKKMPMRTIRYERVVTEKIEDKAKKGKFTEVTSKKIIKEKEQWNYLNRVGISIIAVVSSVMILMFCSFGSTFSQAIAGTPSYNNAIYDDSMLFVYELGAEGTGKATVEVHDQMAYKYIAYAVKDLKWDNSKKAYVKNYSGDVSRLVPTAPNFSKNEGDGKITFTTYDSAYSSMRVTLKNAKEVKSVIFNKDDVNRESEEYEFNEQETIVFELPYAYDNFDMIIDASCEITFEQHVYNVNNLGDENDWKEFYGFYGGDSNIMSSFKSGMVLRLTKTI